MERERERLEWEQRKTGFFHVSSTRLAQGCVDGSRAARGREPQDGPAVPKVMRLPKRRLSSAGSPAARSASASLRVGSYCGWWGEGGR